MMLLIVAALIGYVSASAGGAPDCWPVMPAVDEEFAKMKRVYKGDAATDFMVVVEPAMVAPGGTATVTVKSVKEGAAVVGFVVNAMMGEKVVGTLAGKAPTMSHAPSKCEGDDMKGTQTHKAAGTAQMETFTYTAGDAEGTVKLQAIGLLGTKGDKASQFFWTAHADLMVKAGADAGTTAASTDAPEGTTNKDGETNPPAEGTTVAPTTDAPAGDCTKVDACGECVAMEGCKYCSLGMTRKTAGTGKCAPMAADCGTLLEKAGEELTKPSQCVRELDEACQKHFEASKDQAGCEACVAAEGCALCSTADKLSFVGVEKFTGASCNYVGESTDGDCVLATATKITKKEECAASAGTLVFSAVIALVAIVAQF